MALLDFIDKIDDIVYEPVKVVCDYLHQPLYKKQNSIQNQSKELESRLVRQEAEHKVQLEEQKNEHEMQLRIKERKLNAEIDEYIQRSNFSIRKDIVDTIKQYQIDLSRTINDCIKEIGNMSIELREKANNLMLEKVKCYKELQEESKAEATKQLQEINITFADNERVRIRMEDEVIDQMHNMIKMADKFINELSEDIKRLNSNVDDLTKNGQKMVEEYLKPIKAQMKEINYNKIEQNGY